MENVCVLHIKHSFLKGICTLDCATETVKERGIIGKYFKNIVNRLEKCVVRVCACACNQHHNRKVCSVCAAHSLSVHPNEETCRHVFESSYSLLVMVLTLQMWVDDYKYVQCNDLLYLLPYLSMTLRCYSSAGWTVWQHNRKSPGFEGNTCKITLLTLQIMNGFFFLKHELVLKCFIVVNWTCFSFSKM